MVTRNEVIYAYRLLLGREPESEGVINEFLTVPDWASLRDLFLQSAEFKAMTNPGQSIELPVDFMMSPRSKVDVVISEEHFERLVRHVQTVWEKSVVASDISRPHLRIASEHLQSKGVGNVTFLQLKSLETLESIVPFDNFLFGYRPSA
jgi:hypothetical protein